MMVLAVRERRFRAPGDAGSIMADVAGLRSSDEPGAAALTTPSRRPGSVRRTSHVDLLPHGDRMAAGFDIHGTARDLRTDGAGTAAVLDEAAVAAGVGPGQVAAHVTTTPARPATEAFAGHPITSGFRARLATLLPDERDARTPLYLLLDELPIAAVISGYADLYTSPEVPGGSGSWEGALTQADICAGWATEAQMIQTIRTEGRMPVPLGPQAAEPVDDDLGWHALDALPPGAMRRRRRLDVFTAPDGSLGVDAMFRDTHVDADTGVETVLHEWWVDAAVDPGSQVVLRAAARPGPLPWGECPSAAGSAARLVGQPAGSLRDHVRTDLRGTSTCTHLNDLLRSLADVPALASRLAP